MSVWSIGLISSVFNSFFVSTVCFTSAYILSCCVTFLRKQEKTVIHSRQNTRDRPKNYSQVLVGDPLSFLRLFLGLQVRSYSQGDGCLKRNVMKPLSLKCIPEALDSGQLVSLLFPEIACCFFNYGKDLVYLLTI